MAAALSVALCFVVPSLMSVQGQSLPKWVIRDTSAYPPIATAERTLRDVSSVPLTEVVHFHSITLSARAITLSGMGRPSAAAVLRFRASSKTTGCSTGNSAGSAPLKIRAAEYRDKLAPSHVRPKGPRFVQ